MQLKQCNKKLFKIESELNEMKSDIVFIKTVDLSLTSQVCSATTRRIYNEMISAFNSKNILHALKQIQIDNIKFLVYKTELRDKSCP